MLKQLQRTLTPPRQIMTVNADNGDGTVTVTAGNGGTVRAIGIASVGSKVYVQDRRVLGPAPDLPHGVIEV